MRAARSVVRGSVVVLGGRVTALFVRGVSIVFRVITAPPVRGVARRTIVRGPVVLPVRGVTALLLGRDGVLTLRGAPLGFADALARLELGVSAKLWRVATHRPNRAQIADTVTTARGASLMEISGLLTPLVLIDERPEILIDHDQFAVVERTARLGAGRD